MRARRLKEATFTPPIVTSRAAGNTRTVEIDGRSITLTNLDRVLYPEDGFTKADLVDYWLAVADVILPHLADRPLTVGRFPGGVDGRGFAQAEVPGRPDWIPTRELALLKGPVKRFTLVRERAALVWLAQMGTIELHAFPGLPGDLDRTTRILFDLDPKPPGDLVATARAALLVRDRLAHRGVSAWAKTSGSLGLHVIGELAEPIAVKHARAIAQDIQKELSRELAALSVVLDARQNSARLTTVVPYSLRSTPRPLVSTPLEWAEVAQGAEHGDRSLLVFSAADVVRRVKLASDDLARDRS
jgi:bifunctional non-homologous end joining protein LigD